MAKRTPLRYNELELPFYKNSRVVAEVGGLEITATEAAGIVPVLAGLNVMLIDDTGWGKTQLISDIYNFYFGGNANGVWFKARPDTEITDVFYKLNLGKARRELTTSVAKLVFCVDEINRAPGPVQDQFLGLGDGTSESPDGNQIELGVNGYSVLLATANMGNGEFSGSFDMDRALLNRLHITFDLSFYGTTMEDDLYVTKMQGAKPKVQIAKQRDISDKIIKAWNDITSEAEDAGIKAEIALMFLGRGLQHCAYKGRKTLAWPDHCQSCDGHGGKDLVCEITKAATPRTRRAILRYACGLKYLAGLKAKHNKKQLGTIDDYDLIFTAFKLAAGYHGNLNPGILKNEYHDENAALMNDLDIKLQEEFANVKSYISIALQCKRKFGDAVTQFVHSDTVFPVHDGLLNEIYQQQKRQYGSAFNVSFDEFKQTIINKGKIVEPFKDEGNVVGYAWVPKMLETVDKDE